jgi:DNA-binding MarR family transcriptional regulator
MMRAVARAGQADADEGNKSAEVPNGWIVPDLDYPTFRVTLIAKVMDRLTLRRLARHGALTYAEWRVLSRLATMSDGATVGQNADLAWVDRAEVSRAASTLEQRGLTARRPNEGDKRRPILHLTDSGWAEYRRLAEDRTAFHAELLADLDATERADLDRLLAKIGTRLTRMLREEQGG